LNPSTGWSLYKANVPLDNEVTKSYTCDKTADKVVGELFLPKMSSKSSTASNALDGSSSTYVISDKGAG
jgi:hypothetical protein